MEAYIGAGRLEDAIPGYPNANGCGTVVEAAAAAAALDVPASKSLATSSSANMLGSAVSILTVGTVPMAGCNRTTRVGAAAAAVDSIRAARPAAGRVVVVVVVVVNQHAVYTSMYIILGLLIRFGAWFAAPRAAYLLCVGSETEPACLRQGILASQAR
jgi:hypothetical protein